MSNRRVNLLRVVTSAITAYVSGTLQPASVDAQGNTRVALVGAASGASVVIDSAGRLMTRQPDNWSAVHVPATNLQATVTRAASAGVAHVCNSISFSLLDPTGLIATPVAVNLRDSTTGAGTILWSLNVLSIGFPVVFSVSGLNIVGTSGNAMTLEFAAAGGAGTFESVTLTGYET